MSNLGLNFSELIQNDWKNVFSQAKIWERHAPLFEEVAEAYRVSDVYPPIQHVFEAFHLCTFSSTRVIIIGQDPYHGPGQAHGLSFSVPDGTPFPPSLRNISKELETDIGQGLGSGDLGYWAKQGVLLLNSSLTVRAHEAGSHGKMGWISFTKDILRVLQSEKEHVVVLLWGNHAQKLLRDIQTIDRNTPPVAVVSAHPSPLSAYRGFFGSKPFTAVNQALTEQGQQPIDWSQ